MTATDAEITDLTALDFPIPCEDDDHDTYGDGPAVWIIWEVQCHCEEEPGKIHAVLSCDGCWQECQKDIVYCQGCGCPWRFADAFVRWERIRP